MDDNEKILAEKKLLIDRSYTCPICDNKITAKAVKANSARFVETKADLRPIHSNVNVTKYDTVCCHNCGYSALTKDFKTLNSVQSKLLREKIQANFVPKDEIICDTYTTEMAITRMKMVLLCSMSKGAKSSEIGNICLKISWLYEDLADEIDDSDQKGKEMKENCLNEAKHAGKNAYDKLLEARMHEDFPIAGMNETTLDYLLAYFSYQNEDYSQAMKLLSGVISNRSTAPRLKDKALELKEQIGQKQHEQG